MPGAQQSLRVLPWTSFITPHHAWLLVISGGWPARQPRSATMSSSGDKPFARAPSGGQTALNPLACRQWRNMVRQAPYRHLASCCCPPRAAPPLRCFFLLSISYDCDNAFDHVNAGSDNARSLTIKPGQICRMRRPRSGSTCGRHHIQVDFSPRPRPVSRPEKLTGTQLRANSGSSSRLNSADEAIRVVSASISDPVVALDAKASPWFNCLRLIHIFCLSGRARDSLPLLDDCQRPDLLDRR